MFSLWTHLGLQHCKSSNSIIVVVSIRNNNTVVEIPWQWQISSSRTIGTAPPTAGTVGVDKIICIDLSTGGPVSPDIHELILNRMREFWKFRDISKSYMLINGHNEYSTSFHILPWPSMFFHGSFQSDLRPSSQFYDILVSSMTCSNRHRMPALPTPCSIPMHNWVRLGGTTAVLVGTPKAITGTPTVIAGTHAILVLLLMRFRCLEDNWEFWRQFSTVLSGENNFLAVELRRLAALIDKSGGTWKNSLLPVYCVLFN